MKERAILWATLAFAIWAIKRDTAGRDGISAALWIPTLWVGILASRSMSTWLSGGIRTNPGYSPLDGSPIDMLFYIVLIGAASIAVLKRKSDWWPFILRNWPLVLFYLYLLVSVLWAESSLASFKRWFKEVGNIIVAMVILTEQNPRQAFRAVFVRCAYLLIPLSVVFVRYFPNLGKHYTEGGDLEVIGVTDQKNSLGAMILACGLVIIWDLFENKRPARKQRDRLGLLLKAGILILGAYLLRYCDSKTSIVCLALGGGILATTRMPGLRKRVGHLGLWTLGIILLFSLIDALFGIKEAAVKSLGRDLTFTGRTNIWEVILQNNIDPLFGTGFYSFWSDQHYLSKMPVIPHSAHNGYLEIYMDGGYFAVALLAILLGVTALRINKEISLGATYAVVRYAVLVVAVVANFSESNFARMTPINFLFILVAIDGPRRNDVRLGARNYSSGSIPQPMRQMESTDRPG